MTVPALDLSNMAYRSGVLTGVLRGVGSDLAAARALPTRSQRDDRMDAIAKLIDDTLAKVRESDAAINSRIDACRAAGPAAGVSHGATN